MKCVTEKVVARGGTSGVLAFDVFAVGSSAVTVASSPFSSQVENKIVHFINSVD